MSWWCPLRAQGAQEDADDLVAAYPSDASLLSRRGLLRADLGDVLVLNLTLNPKP